MRIIQELLSFLEYIILMLIPIVLGFAYFWVFHLLKKLSKKIRYLYGSIVPLAINGYYLVQLINNVGQPFSLIVTSFAYFILSLAGTLTYTIMAVTVTSIKK